MKLVADSNHLEYSAVLFARVCAARLDPKLSAEDFVSMLGRLLDVAIAEAAEDQDDLCAPGPVIARSEFSHIEVRSPPISLESNRRCVYCGADGMAGHDCERPRELGFVEQGIPRGGPVARASGAEPRGDQNARDSSMGAARAETKAEHTHNLAPAAETPAAPSHSRLHDTSEDGSGVIDTRGPQARANAHPNGKRLTPEEVDALHKAYTAARRANGGELPRGWYSAQARQLGVTPEAITLRCRPWRDEPLDDSPPPASKVVRAEREQDQRAEREVDDPAEPEREVVHPDAGGRVHTNGHNCWCRKGANKAGNYWCKDAPPIKVLPGLRSRVPPTARNERFTGTMARAPRIPSDD